MIDTSKALKFAGHHHETSPQTVFASGCERCQLLERECQRYRGALGSGARREFTRALKTMSKTYAIADLHGRFDHNG
jgi:hypothetical protein